jgi:hypothetical protein
MPTHTLRFAVGLASALLAVQTLGTVAQAAPASIAPSLARGEVFQNGCVQDQDEVAQADAEGRPIDNPRFMPVQSWRAAFSDNSRSGPIDPRWCWFSTLSPDETRSDR